MMGSSLSAPPQPLWWVPIQPLNLITTAASLRLGFLVHSSFKLYKYCEITGFLSRNKNIAVEHFGYSLVCELNISHLCHVPRLKDVWHEKASRLQGNDFLQFSNDIFASTCSSCMCFFHGGGTRQGSGNEGSPNMETSGRKFFLRKLLPEESCCSGVPSLIDKGQFWRLATSSVLHANIGHLMVNCYSLNSIGPTIENLSGPRRFIAVLPLQ
uniref:Peptidase S54 rhomboid domain-containing protein n=1 Tax=Salix viminalis TaxID=40686 RepID=A0A6N2N339_SALVM